MCKILTYKLTTPLISNQADPEHQILQNIGVIHRCSPTHHPIHVLFSLKHAERIKSVPLYVLPLSRVRLAVNSEPKHFLESVKYFCVAVCQGDPTKHLQRPSRSVPIRTARITIVFN